MSMISEQVKELRKAAKWFEGTCLPEAIKLIAGAADTIESLSAKLQAVNIETTCESGCLHWNPVHGGCIIHNTIPGGCKDFRSIQRQSISAHCGGGWIPCSERLPEDGVDVLVWFEYFRYGEYNRLFQTKGISYTYNGKWSGFVNGQSGWNQLSIIAWQPMPEDYHES